MTQEEFRLGKRPELDGIRALAVLAVITWHIGIPYVRAGNIGVDVFFVLSGFLITTLLLQEWNKTGNISLKNFYARRALRLFPVLFFVMLLYALYSYFYESPIQSANSFLYIAATLLYVANWAQILFGIHHSVLGHTWSLAVEEQFYILYPLLLIAFLRLKIRHVWLLGGFLAIFAAVSLNRYWIWQDKFSYDRTHMSLDTRADALLIGCFVSVLIVNRLVPSRAWLMILVKILSVCSTGVLGLVVVGGVKNETYYKFGVASLVAICVAIVIYDLMCGPRGPAQWLLRNPVLVWIGRISYGLYLWHIPVFAVVGTHPAWSGIQLQAVRLVSVMLVAAASFYLIESPFLRLKHRFSSTDPLPIIETRMDTIPEVAT